jgi:NAD(P)-dependent dehydrogenase (short-subunit alcohol dehydrogenase family)
MDHEFRLKGKKTLVTGAGTGIGREIALEFARQGSDVVLHYAHSDKGAKSALEEILNIGRRGTAFKANFEILDEVLDLGDRAIGFLGGIDCLINNSGISFNKPFLKVTREQFDVIFNVNIRAQYFLTQKVASYMVGHGGGAVVNLTSIHGLAGAPEHTVYAATKGAIIAFTRTLGIELAHKGVRVNAIAPGGVVVEGHQKAVPGLTEETEMASARDTVPRGRYGRPIEIAKLALFLCTEDADYIVGQTLVSDGGTTALMSLMPDFRHEMDAKFGVGYVPGVG